MNLQPKTDIPSNFISDAIIANGERYIYIVSNGQPESSRVRLSDGTSLGAVQSVKWSLGIGDMARCTVETLVSPGDLVALMENTTVKVKPWGNPVKWLWVYYVAKFRGFCKNKRYLSFFRS